jgi:hypothetical protein
MTEAPTMIVLVLRREGRPLAMIWLWTGIAACVGYLAACIIGVAKIITFLKAVGA